jgi:hypothetical protein
MPIQTLDLHRVTCLFTYLVVTNHSFRDFQTSEDPDDQVAVQICQMGKNTIRICFHLDNSDDKMVDQICKKIRFVFNDIKI